MDLSDELRIYAKENRKIDQDILIGWATRAAALETAHRDAQRLIASLLEKRDEGDKKLVDF